jgi:hypothetical protein
VGVRAGRSRDRGGEGTAGPPECGRDESLGHPVRRFGEPLVQRLPLVGADGQVVGVRDQLQDETESTAGPGERPHGARTSSGGAAVRACRTSAAAAAYCTAAPM